jgi:hypothetical protein
MASGPVTPLQGSRVDEDMALTDERGDLVHMEIELAAPPEALLTLRLEI